MPRRKRVLVVAGASQIQEADVLLPFCSIEQENRVFGVGLIGEVQEDSDGFKIAYYSRYVDLVPPTPFSALASEPRGNRRNAINGVNVEVFRMIAAGVSDLDTLPVVSGFAPTSES